MGKTMGYFKDGSIWELPANSDKIGETCVVMMAGECAKVTQETWDALEEACQISGIPDESKYTWDELYPWEGDLIR